MQRIFVVGCPRSGTTLIQALLARYPSVHSFPETGFFEALFGGIERRWQDPDARRDSRWYHQRGLAHRWGRRRLIELEHSMGPGRPRSAPYSATKCIQRYVALLDATARSRERSSWVEKTPNHLMYIDDIARHIPDARFVHVLRNGEDVVASIIDADLIFATRAFRGGVKRWVGRWNHAVGFQLAHLGFEQHHILCLEDMVENFAGEWQRLCTFLEFDAAKPLAAEPGSAIANVAREPWKCDAVAGLLRTPEKKGEQLFGPRIRAWMRDTLVPYPEIRARVALRA